MLALARRAGQKIRIGDDVVVVVREVRGKQVRLGIEAPDEVRVWREEIYESILQANLQGVRTAELPPWLKDLEAQPLKTNVELTCPRFGVVDARELQLSSSVPGIAKNAAGWVQDPQVSAVWWFVSKDAPECALPTLSASVLTSLPLATPRKNELAELGDADVEARVAFSAGPEGVQINRFAPIYWSPRSGRAGMFCALGSGLATQELWPGEP